MIAAIFGAHLSVWRVLDDSYQKCATYTDNLSMTQIFEAQPPPFYFPIFNSYYVTT